MRERKAVTIEAAKRYRRASKKDKSVILSELSALTGWSRRHTRRALNQALLPRATKASNTRRGRTHVYDEDVVQALRKVWSVYGWMCGKRLAPFLAEGIAVLERCGELELDPGVRAKLMQMSAATIDRRLASDRRRHQIKGRQGTKPGTLLRNQIAIRTFSDWDDARPGFCECDLVGHDGGSSAGEYAQTLTVTCVASGWTEPRALQNKAQRWCFEALKQIQADLPFPLLGIDSDNGSEFINHHLQRWCEAEEITFTRTRPYRKNDNAFVEQKNWSVVRQATGYHRYDTPAELAVLTELYAHLRLYVNFFQPSQKLVEKTRRGAKVHRKHDKAQTPYRRLLDSPHVTPAAKAALTRTYKALNPAQLQRDIVRCQKRLIELVVKKKRTSKRKEVSPPLDSPYRRFEYGKRAATEAVEARKRSPDYQDTGKRPARLGSGPTRTPGQGKTSTRTSSMRQRKARSRTS